MKKNRLLFTALFFFAINNAAGQNITDSIRIIKNIGILIVQKDIALRPNEMLDIMKLNSFAFDEMKKARNSQIGANILGFSGGFLIGWSITNVFLKGEPQWVRAGIGFGMVALSIPLSANYTKHAKNAVKIFNEGLPYKSYGTINFNIEFSTGGLGLVVRF